MEASEQGKVPHSKRPAFWVIVVISVMAVVVIIRMMGGLTDSLKLPAAGEVTSVLVERVDNRLSTGSVSITDKKEIETLIGLFADKRKTMRQSVSDTPQGVANYYKITLNTASESRTLFAYTEFGGAYLEEPYEGVYSISKDDLAKLTELKF